MIRDRARLPAPPWRLRSDGYLESDLALMRELAEDDQLGRIFKVGEQSYWTP